MSRHQLGGPRLARSRGPLQHLTVDPGQPGHRGGAALPPDATAGERQRSGNAGRDAAATKVPGVIEEGFGCDDAYDAAAAAVVRVQVGGAQG